MEVIKCINNNVAICVDDNGHELVAFGKGIGFKKPPYEVDLNLIQQTYYNLDSHYLSLLDEIPEEMMNLAFEIVAKGKLFLGIEVNKSFVFTLADHINFAVERTKQGLLISNPMLNEVRHMYEKEMELGEWAVKLIEKNQHLSLPESEAGNIAVHFINAKNLGEQEQSEYDLENTINDVTRIIENGVAIQLDRSSFNYSRFVTHLKYLLKRANIESIPASDNLKMYASVAENFPHLENIVVKIRDYLKTYLDIHISDEEMLYLMLHVNKLCAREGL